MMRKTNKELEAICNKLRSQIIVMINESGSGHPGGSFSALDIIAYLYNNVMRIDPNNPRDAKRDRFILSKGHCAPAIYVVLSDKGFFPEETLYTLRDVNSKLQGHPDMNKTPGIDMTTGSLGMGLSAGVGMALGAQIDGFDYQVYVMCGDGEMQEGQIWEALMTAGNRKLGNLTLIVDRNGFQCDGRVDDANSLGDLEGKLRCFGFDVITIDGHDFDDIKRGFEFKSVKPKAIIANTVKGKGVSFMENDNLWHGTPPSNEQREKALNELGNVIISAD